MIVVAATPVASAFLVSIDCPFCSRWWIGNRRVGVQTTRSRVLFDRAGRRDDDSAAVGQDRRSRPACAGRGVLRAAVHRDGPDRLSQRGRGLAGGAGSGAVDGRRGGVSAESVRHGGGGVGVAGGDGREVPAGSGHAGAHACGAAVRRGLRASGSAAARLRARGEGVLQGVPDGTVSITTAISTTWTSSRRSGARGRSTRRIRRSTSRR